MKEELFDELVVSLRQGMDILRGDMEPSRSFVVEPPDVKGIRDGYNLSQAEFAALLGISVKTLQNWEQKRRTPRGAARVLLEVAAKHPDIVWDVVRPAKEKGAVAGSMSQRLRIGAICCVSFPLIH